jgi:hypothetical protein
MNRRASPPVLPGSDALPRQCGSIRDHCASVRDAVREWLCEQEARKTGAHRAVTGRR